jgi:hypothetical protein
MPGNISGINGRFIKPVLTRKEKGNENEKTGSH